MRLALCLIGSLGVAGCAYHGGSFADGAHTFPGRRATVGCLDLSIDRRAGVERGGATVLEYQFGNRCDRAITIDLARAAVVARTAEGATHVLAPYDPNGEMRALPLDGRRAGGEAIAYPIAQLGAELCVDAASLHREPGAAVRGPHWICFAGDAAAAADAEHEEDDA